MSCELHLAPGLPRSCRAHEVEEAFAKFGKVEFVFLPPAEYRHTNPSLVKFRDQKSATDAARACKEDKVMLGPWKAKTVFHSGGKARAVGGEGSGGSSSSSRPSGINEPPPPVKQTAPQTWGGWQRGGAGGKQQMAGPAHKAFMPPSQQVEEFCSYWNMTEDLKGTFRRLLPQAQVQLMSQHYKLAVDLHAAIRSYSEQAGRFQGKGDRKTRGDRMQGRQRGARSRSQRRSGGGQEYGEQGRYYGTLEAPIVKHNPPANGPNTFRFIECKDIPERFNAKRAFILPQFVKELAAQPVGTQVSFILREEPVGKRPQADDVKVHEGVIPNRPGLVKGGGKGNAGRARQISLKNNGRHDKRLERFISVNKLDAACAQALKDAPARMQGVVIDAVGDKLQIVNPDGRPHMNPSAFVYSRLKSEQQAMSQSQQQEADRRSPTSRRGRAASSDEEDARSRSRRYDRSCSDSYTEVSECEGGAEEPAVAEGTDIVGAQVPISDQSHRRVQREASPSRSQSRSQSRSPSPRLQGVGAQKQAEGSREEASANSSLIEVSNIPDLSGRGVPPDKYLSSLFNPSLETLPDFTKDAGPEPVVKSWIRPAKAMAPLSVIMQMQSSELAASSVRTLHGLELFGSTLKVRGMNKSEAERMQQGIP
eukprot:gb/GFBE01051258.1/.p1 GENE.gb/GFBE01051258.1/~~gb/GFBE01051258.1/.p1  ORF type:complete len:649 (+),score=104.77 gb/GFBE01051258.1/:1-1947(+)